MSSILLKNIVLIFMAFLFSGCVSSSLVNRSLAPDCNKTLTFVESPSNTVSEDGFTILYDGKSEELFQGLLKKALENQNAYGCNKG